MIILLYFIGITYEALSRLKLTCTLSRNSLSLNSTHTYYCSQSKAPDVGIGEGSVPGAVVLLVTPVTHTRSIPFSSSELRT